MGTFRSVFPINLDLSRFERDVANAAASTLKKLSRTGRTVAAREVAKKYNITVTEAKRRIVFEINGLSSVRLVAMNRGRKLQQSIFKPKQEAKGVSVQILRGGERILIPHSFLATGKVMGRQVFIRVGRARLPLTLVKGVYMSELITDDIREKVTAAMNAQMQKVFTRELNYYTKVRRGQ